MSTNQCQQMKLLWNTAREYMHVSESGRILCR